MADRSRRERPTKDKLAAFRLVRQGGRRELKVSGSTDMRIGLQYLDAAKSFF